MSFSDALRDLRLSRELTQSDLAKATGMFRSAISMYEQGNREPDFETLEVFADYFNVDLNYLMDKTPQDLDGDDGVWKLRDELRRRPELKILFSATE